MNQLETMKKISYPNILQDFNLIIYIDMRLKINIMKVYVLLLLKFFFFFLYEICIFKYLYFSLFIIFIFRNAYNKYD